MKCFSGSGYYTSIIFFTAFDLLYTFELLCRRRVYRGLEKMDIGLLKNFAIDTNIVAYKARDTNDQNFFLDVEL